MRTEKSGYQHFVTGIWPQSRIKMGFGFLKKVDKFFATLLPSELEFFEL
jgi:hypothetical protein